MKKAIYLFVSMLITGACFAETNTNNIFVIQSPDKELSPHTGMTRQHWFDAGQYLLEGAFSYVDSMDDSLLFPKQPGKSRHSGNNDSRLESLARTLFIAAPLMKKNPDLTISGIKLADYYRHHLLLLSDEESPTFIPDRADPNAWPGQSLVEFGAVSISMFVAPEILWEPLTKTQQDELARKMLSHAQGTTVPSNWKFFNILIMSFFKSQGYEVDEELLVKYLKLSLKHYRGEGWYNDNPCYDYYSMWAFQMYAIVWAHVFGDEHYPEISAKFRSNFKDMMVDYPRMFSRDGEMIMWGRSIAYRFAAASVFPLAGLDSDVEANWGWLRRISSSCFLQFLQHPDFLEDRIPQMGFYGHFEPSIQEYLSRGSVFWMGKMFVGLIVPEDHPFWTATENNGEWNSLSKTTANTKFFKGSEILLNDYTNIGASEIRAWCNVNRGKHDHGRDSANYGKLAYNSAFPWQENGLSGETSMAFYLQNENEGWFAPLHYTFVSYKDGVYQRKLQEEAIPSAQLLIADIPLSNGVLRVDMNVSTEPVKVRLGHFALPQISGEIKEETRTVKNAEARIISNEKYSLALVNIRGWDKIEIVDCNGLNPETETSKVINVEDSFDLGQTNGSKLYVTLMLFKPSGETWSDEELYPIDTIGNKASDSVIITMNNGHKYAVEW